MYLYMIVEIQTTESYIGHIFIRSTKCLYRLFWSRLLNGCVNLSPGIEIHLIENGITRPALTGAYTATLLNNLGRK